MIQINREFAPVRNLLALTDRERLTRWEKRIFAEMRFICTLSGKGDGRYDGLIAETERYLKEQYGSFGVLTRNAVSEAEKLLAPAAEEAKSYQFLCVAHAHIDMNWQWGYDETVGTTIDTFRTMLNIMKEYPEFKFSQSQASVYRIVEENDPQMLEEIKQRVREGRWEITASAWVENDKNMPNGESLSRHILYTKDYLSGLFGISADDMEIDFEPDTFGHSANVPEVLSNGGVKYYYHCRGHVGEAILQRWEAPSGADVLLYTEPFWYSATIDEHIGDYAAELERITGSRTLLKVYGVGDHGGGPTRRDIERILDMNSWPIYPKFRFSFLRDYFKAVEGLKSTLPTVRGEINFLCDGCYTTQSRIKAGNRKSERLLRESEAFSALSAVQAGYVPPVETHRDAWRKVLFNQFHDIIPGSGVTETREYASGLYQQVFGAAESIKKAAFRQICDRIDTAKYISFPERAAESTGEGAGPGFGPGFGFCGRGVGKERAYVLFNGEASARTEVTELTLWDYEGDLDYLAVKDSEGRKTAFQILERNVGYWGHQFTRVLIEASVPAMGYALYMVCEQEDLAVETVFINDMRVQIPDEFVLENDLLQVRLNPLDGSISSLVYKPAGREFVDQLRPSGIFRLVQEAGAKSVTGWNRGMSAWFVGRYNEVESAQKRVELKPVCGGPLRWAVRYTAEFASSKMEVTISLDKGSTNLCYSVDCDWREFGSEDRIPALNFYFPFNYGCDTYRFDVPLGTADRKGRDMDLPGSSFAAAPADQESVMLLAKTKYGYRCHHNSIAVTLIRSGCDPDPTPEIGRHQIEFAVAVAGKDWTGQDYIRHSGRYHHAFSVVPVESHTGDLPPVCSMLEPERGSVVISAVKTPENGERAILIRVYETDGQSAEVSLRLGFRPVRAQLTDITERYRMGEAVIKDNRVIVPIGAYRMRTVKIYY